MKIYMNNYLKTLILNDLFNYMIIILVKYTTTISVSINL
jgi:hypothetical protein